MSALIKKDAPLDLFQHPQLFHHYLSTKFTSRLAEDIQLREVGVMLDDTKSWHTRLMALTNFVIGPLVGGEGSKEAKGATTLVKCLEKDKCTFKDIIDCYAYIKNEKSAYYKLSLTSVASELNNFLVIAADQGTNNIEVSKSKFKTQQEKNLSTLKRRDYKKLIAIVIDCYQNLTKKEITLNDQQQQRIEVVLGLVDRSKIDASLEPFQNETLALTTASWLQLLNAAKVPTKYLFDVYYSAARIKEGFGPITAIDMIRGWDFLKESLPDV